MKKELKNYTLNLELDIKALCLEQAFSKFEAFVRKGNWRQDDICVVYEDNVKKLSFASPKKKGK